MPHKITVKTNGQTLTVNASVSHWTSEALALAASGTNDVESTTTTTITSDYDLWFANTATTATITVKQLDGTTLLADTFQVSPAYGNRTLNPLPTLDQLAADVSGDQGYLSEVSSGFESVPRVFLAAQSATLTSGRLTLTYFVARKSMTVSSMRYVVGGTAAGATPTVIRYGLFTLDGDDGTLVASTANDTTLLASGSTGYTKALSEPYAVTAGTRYAASIVVVTGATAPTVQASYCGVTGQATVAPRLGGYWGSQTDMPASFLASNLTATTTQPYVVFL